jgi:serpin B
MKSRNPAMMCVVLGLCLAIAEAPLYAAEAEVAESDRVVQGNTAFAMDLYDVLKSQPGNLFFSPFSISSALAMTYAGARGKTAEEMENVLYFDLKQEELHKGFSRVQSEINEAGESGGFELNTANSLWCQNDYEFLEEFLELTRKYYEAAIHKADFENATEKARVAINSWVEEKTNGKITDLIKPGQLDPTTALVLVNAIYFKGDWVFQFDKDKTQAEPFFVEPEKRVEVQMMHRKAKLRYQEFGQFSAIELPYTGRDLSMVILLPAELYGLGEVEKELTASRLEDAVRTLASSPPADVDVALPKFEMTSEFQLAETLAKMGMPSAFSPMKADFSGMNGIGGLYINRVIHKAFVDVNEEGTEAAAATSVHILKAAISPVPSFRADHPFLFMIRDNHTGSILFMGRVTDPTA